MFRHERIRRALAFYNHLPPEERAAVDAHVQRCQECAQRLRAYRAMDEALAALPMPAPSPGLRARFLSQMRGLEAIEPASSPASRLTLARGLVLAGLAVVLILFWGVMHWMSSNGFSRPGMTISSPSPLTPTMMGTSTPAEQDGLQEVPFHFDMAQCHYFPNAWNQDGLVALRVDRVLLSVQDWDAHQRWRVEGHYRSAAGDFYLSIFPKAKDYFTYTTQGDSVLREGEGNFVVEGHVSEGTIDLPRSFDLVIFDQTSAVSSMGASCTIQIGSSQPPTPTPTLNPNTASRSTGWQRDYWKQERERALHYAPAVAEWIAQRTWFTLPASIPWDYHQPMNNAIGSMEMGQVQFTYLAPKTPFDYAQRRLSFYWRRGEPEGWDDTTVFPHKFVRPSIDYTLPIQERMQAGRDLPGRFVWSGTREIDGWTGKLWRRKLLGRPDEYWLLWHDADANLTYVMILNARDDSILDTLLQDFHAQNPDRVSAVQQAVMSWTDFSLTWVPPWLTEDLRDVPFTFDPGACFNPDDDAPPPLELNLTRLAVNRAEDGVLRWVLEGEYAMTADASGATPQILLGLYPAHDAMLNGGVLAPFRTSVMRTGVSLLPEYRRFAMLTEMQPPADGSLPQELILTIQVSPQAPGWQCPVRVISDQ